MASIEKRGKAYRVIAQSNGARETATFDTRAEAVAWGRVMDGKKEAGTFKSSKVAGRRVADLLEDYMETIAEQRDSARNDRVRIMRWLREPPINRPLRKDEREPIAHMRLTDVTRDWVNKWIAKESGRVSERTDRVITAGTMNRELNILSGAFTYAKDVLEWIEVNPFHKAKRPAPDPGRDRPLLTEDEIDAILLAIGYRDDPLLRTKTSRVGAMFLLALETGMRSGELLRLRKEDVFLEQKVLIVRALSQGGRKGGKSGHTRRPASRHVPLTDTAIHLLERLMRHIPEDQKATVGQPYVPYIIGMTDAQRDALWRKARNKSGVQDLTFHDAKHEACTRLSKFCDIFELSHAVGTKDLALLRDVYYASDAERVAKSLPTQLTPLRRPRLRVVDNEEA